MTDMSDYTIADIKRKEDIEAVQCNAVYYCGDVETPDKLPNEIVDNSLDEIISGFGTALNIYYEKDGTITVIDNGRGIPLDYSKADNMYVPEMIYSFLHISAKFKTEEERKYKCSIGLHGVGGTVVNALSTDMIIKVKRKDKFGVFVFKDGKCINREVKNQKNDQTGTMVSFIPNSSYFEEMIYDIHTMLLKLKFAVACKQELTACLFDNINNKTYKIYNVTMKEIFETTYINMLQNVIYDDYQKIDVEDPVTNEKLTILFNYDKDKYDVKIRGCVNLALLDNGTHITITKQIFQEVFSELYSANNKAILQSTDCLIGLRCLVITFLDDSRFSSQAKSKLATKKDSFNTLKSKAKDKLKKLLKLNVNKTTELIDKFVAYRNSLTFTKTKKKGKKKRKIDKITRALNNTGLTLFIVEGESAAGSVIDARDEYHHTVYPLKGKPLNVERSTDSTIIKNKEIMDLIQEIDAVAFEGGTFIDTGGCKFDNIVFLADADVDGKHIVTLLSKLFKKLMPRLIEEERVFIGLMPLYGLPKKKGVDLIYDINIAESYMKKGVKLLRYKGLGEMDPFEELEPALYGSKARRILLIND